MTLSTILFFFRKKCLFYSCGPREISLTFLSWTQNVLFLNIIGRSRNKSTALIKLS